MTVFPVISMKRFDFNNTIIAIKLYFVMILIKVMKDCESLTGISVEYDCKDYPAWFKCFKMINRWKHSLEI